MQHVLPKGFTRFRHYGLFAASNVSTKLEVARSCLAAPEGKRDAATSTPAVTDTRTLLLAVTGIDIDSVTVTDTDSVTVTDTDPVTVTDTDSVTVTDTDSVTVTDTDSVTVTASDTDSATAQLPAKQIRPGSRASIVRMY